MDEKYYIPHQVAEMFGVKTITVWDWIRKGKLRAYRFGGKRYRISDKQIDAFKKKYDYTEVSED